MEENEKKAQPEMTFTKDGMIDTVTENGKPLEYGDEEKRLGKKMDDGKTSILSNPCRWVKIGGKWRCI